MQRTPSSLCFLLVLIVLLSLFILVRSPEPMIRPFSEGGEWVVVHENIVISAMHRQFLRRNKVVMFDRTNLRPSNFTFPAGLCHCDPPGLAPNNDCAAHSLLYDFLSNFIRPLNIQTDTWYSSRSLTRDGELLQMGGYNDGERMVRVLFPCPDFAICDWIELARWLVVRRWYASNQILPDGRIIIVGERGQPLPDEDNLYPMDPREKVDLDFLKQTRQDPDEDNLYPFLHLLPYGNLFISANMLSATIFDYRRGAIPRELPSINPDDDSRNYPNYSGSSVLLPMRLSDESLDGVEQVEVLIYGGSSSRSFRRALHGHFLSALSTCGWVSLTDPPQRWQMEIMLRRRVLEGDMLRCPDHQPRQARHRLLAPRTEPSKAEGNIPAGRPRSQRFSLMNASPMARMYHSSSIVLPNGRVLVGGSNRNDEYAFSSEVEFPTKVRQEAFLPPYLSPDNLPLRPYIAYIRWDVNSFSGICFPPGDDFPAAAEVVVNLLSTLLTTHSFAMNQRRLGLPVVTVKPLSFPPTLEVTAICPRTAEIAPPGHYMLFVVHPEIPSPGVWIKIQ